MSYIGHGPSHAVFGEILANPATVRYSDTPVDWVGVVRRVHLT